MGGPLAQRNVPYYGDILDILHRNMRDESVELVYLDPPFSNANCDMIVGETSGRQVAW